MPTDGEGVTNLVKNCAEVKPDERVVILNEQGSMDPEVADLIAAAVRAVGASVETLWAEAAEGGPGGMGGETMPDAVAAAIASADKVIANYPLRDRALAQVLGDSPRVLVIHNMMRTQEHFASNHASFHWGMANAIYERFQNELFAEGRRFRLAGAGGTDVVGVIGPRAARAKQLEDEHWPFSRSFNSPAFVPVASLQSEGRAVIEYTGGFRRVPIDCPPTVIIEDNRIVRVEGPPAGERWVEEYSRLLDARLEQNGPDANRVDSWHGGLHPTAECTAGPRGLISNASTEMMHFHLGPDGAHAQMQWGRATLELDGEPVLEKGRYAPSWDDPKLQEVARQLGLRSWREG